MRPLSAVSFCPFVSDLFREFLHHDRTVWSLVANPVPMSTLEVAVAFDAARSKESIKYFTYSEFNVRKIVSE